jgi:hypothetical protein
MSAESPIPSLSPQGLKDKKPQDYMVRFVFGASISLIAALVSLKYQLFGGVFLAFPAILPASLTLVERDSGRKEASIDAEGAIIGAVGQMAFALVAAFGIEPLGAITALMMAAVSWLLVAVTIYSAVMGWRAAKARQPRRTEPG